MACFAALHNLIKCFPASAQLLYSLLWQHLNHYTQNKLRELLKYCSGHHAQPCVSQHKESQPAVVQHLRMESPCWTAFDSSICLVV